MKTVVLASVFPPQVGGSGQWLWELYGRFPKGQVAVLAGDSVGAAEFDRRHGMRIQRRSFAFASWGCLGPREFARYARFAWHAARFVKTSGADVVHAAGLLPEGWLAYWIWRTRGVPYWVYVHGEELNIARQSRQLTWMIKRIVRDAQGVIANSTNTARMLTHEVGPTSGKIHVMHPGVDATRFRPAARSDAIRHRLGWTGRTVVLTVGRLQARKGHDMMIRALHAIRDQVPDLLFSVVGDGEERKPLEELIRSEGVENCVQLLGEANGEDLVRCYQQCDLFVLPNREVNGDFEGFGMVLVEAQACGRPVVAGRSGGTSETMREGETGLLVDCTAPGPLASAVCELLLDRPRREQMGGDARKWAESTFDWRALVHQAESIFSRSTPGRSEHASAPSDEELTCGFPS